jgi:class 3 adenylate cyclase
MTTSTLPEDDVGYGTSTSVSGDWANCDDEADGASLTAVLVVRIAGQDSLAEIIGDGETQQALDRCIKRVVRAAETFGGRSVEAPQYEIIADFDQTDAAMQSAIEMQKRVSSLPPVSGVKLMLHIGLSSGVLTEKCDPPSGAIADMASRMAWLADPGQIMACPRAQSALSPELEMRFDEYCRERMRSNTAALEPSPVTPAVAEGTPHSVTQAGSEEEQKPKGLMLKFDGKIFLLNDSNPVIQIGRDADNSVVLRGNSASRHHANIKRRGNDIVFTDTSTNGTFVSFKNEGPYLLLIKGECTLHGSGVLSFSTSDPLTGIGTTSAKFEVL